MKTTPLFYAAALALLACIPLQADNLLKNPELELNDKGNAPKNWKTYSSIQKISTDEKEAPSGSKESLRVDIVADGGNALGQILQKLPVKAKTDYVFRMDIKSSVSGIGLGQIKLMSLRSELERLPTKTSSKKWITVELEFNSGNADNVLVILRYKQKADQEGETIWFANPVLTEK
ncbi:hypothetical protein P3T73_18360 [Kiritimatiellota bacterium B12222]|nr:hypothetical protein P3T73_18360 [Kiritimatiellota bacterium B12222]